MLSGRSNTYVASHIQIIPPITNQTFFLNNFFTDDKEIQFSHFFFLVDQLETTIVGSFFYLIKK
jgi:hypothetical protein